VLPQMTVDKQIYTDKSNQKHTFAPVLESVAAGFSYHLGLRVDDFSIDLDSSAFEYISIIEASHNAVTEDTDVNCTVSEARYGVNYHVERELAGIFAGIGISNVREELKFDSNDWTYSATTPYLKIGFDFILGTLVIRYEQIYMTVGKHSLQTTSGGILFVF